MSVQLRCVKCSGPLERRTVLKANATYTLTHTEEELWCPNCQKAFEHPVAIREDKAAPTRNGSRRVQHRPDKGGRNMSTNTDQLRVRIEDLEKQIAQLASSLSVLHRLVVPNIQDPDRRRWWQFWK